MKIAALKNRVMLTGFTLMALEGTAGAFTGVARFNLDGSLDTTLGGTGRLVGGGPSDTVQVVVPRVGKTYTAGTFITNTGTRQILLARLNGDGSADTSFGWLGVTTAFFSGAAHNDQEYVADIVVDSSGRIVVLCGSGLSGPQFTSGHTLFVTRFNSNGALDTTFGVNGFATPYGVNTLESPWSVALLSGGNIVLTDSRFTIEGAEAGVVLLNSSGATLWSRRIGLESPSIRGVPYAVAVDPSDRIIVAGTGSNGNMAVTRLSSIGNRDTNFGNGGRIAFNWGVQSKATDVILDLNSRIVLVGNKLNGNTLGEMLLARVTALGQVDTSWQGSAVVNGTVGSPDDAWTIRRTSDAKYVVAGRTKVNGAYNFMVSRFFSTSLAFDTTFSGGGIAVIGFPGHTNAMANSLAIDTQFNNRPTVVGTITD